MSVRQKIKNKKKIKKKNTSFIKVRKSRGPSMDPCGTPHLIVKLFELDDLY